MFPATRDIVDILKLDPQDRDVFRGYSPQTGWHRVFGGQVVAQALAAACRTVIRGEPHALHGCFILPGDPTAPIDYRVQRLRDGQSFATRYVQAVQNDRAIFTLLASFQAQEDGFEHQMTMPQVPGPETLPDDAELRARVLPTMPPHVRAYFQRERPVELRPVDFRRYLGQRNPEGRNYVWLRIVTPLPDDPVVHACALAYATDLTLLDASLIPHGRTVYEREIVAASLDHALWLHRPFRADDWLLYAQDSPNAGGGRGFSRGSIFSRDGRLVASAAQEGMIRQRRT